MKDDALEPSLPCQGTVLGLCFWHVCVKLGIDLKYTLRSVVMSKRIILHHGSRFRPMPFDCILSCPDCDQYCLTKSICFSVTRIELRSFVIHQPLLISVRIGSVLFLSAAGALLNVSMLPAGGIVDSSSTNTEMLQGLKGRLEVRLTMNHENQTMTLGLTAKACVNSTCITSRPVFNDTVIPGNLGTTCFFSVQSRR